MSEDVPSWQRGQKHQEGEGKMFDEYINVIKHMADLQNEDTRRLVSKIRLQNRAARAQRRDTSPRSRALAALARRLEGYAQQWAVLFEGQRVGG